MKMTIGKKLGAVLAFMLALMFISSLLVYLKVSTIRQMQQTEATLRIPTILADKEFQRELTEMLNKSRQAILASGNKGNFEKAKVLFDNAHSAGLEDIARLDELAPRWTRQENRDRLETIKNQFAALTSTEEAAMSTSVSGQKDAITKAGVEITVNGTAPTDEIKKELEEMAVTQQASLKESQDRINADSQTMVYVLWGSTILSLILSFLVGLYLSRSISNSTAAALERAEAIAGGDLSGSDVAVTTNDEMKALTVAINKMQSNLRSIVQSISENSQNVANASQEFSSVSQQISSNSEETSAQANAVSSATDEVNRNLNTVATATEEMSASISEIAKNATEAAKVAAEAMRTANETNAIVGKLGASSAEIGQVIKTITSIAQKTDLLALNATVEAARAGEVGAGFAVVANEVKELAKQTAAATEDISRKIEAIQVDTKGAVQAITAIAGVITRVNEISGTIAAAVEEQSATANEMSRNLTEAAKGASQVTENIGGVARAAQNTSQGATDSLKAAQQLAQLSHKLRQLVEQFKLEKYSGSSPSRPYAAPSTHSKFSSEREQHQEVFTR